MGCIHWPLDPLLRVEMFYVLVNINDTRPIESPPASARDTSDTSSKSEDSEYTLASLSEGEVSEVSSGPDVSGHNVVDATHVFVLCLMCMLQY